MRYLTVFTYILIAFLFLLLPANAAITRNQEISAVGNSSSASATFGSASTSGNLLIAALSTYLQTVSTPTGWTLAVKNENVNGGFTYIFYKPAATSTTTISIPLTSGRWILFIAEYSGIITSTPLDATGSATVVVVSPPTPAVSGNAVTSFANELVISLLGSNNSDTYSSPTGGFTLVDQDVTTFGGTIATSAAYLDLISSTPGTYSTSANNFSGGNGVIASFNAGTATSQSNGTALLTGN